MKNYNEQMFQSLSECELMVCEGGCGGWNPYSPCYEDLYRPSGVDNFLAIFGW